MNIPAHTRPIHTTRWANFRSLLADRKLTVTAAAALLDKPQGQVSHFGGKTPTKVIGDQIAAEIETAFELPAGALDMNGSREDGVKSSHLEVRHASHFHLSDAPMLAEAEKWLRFQERVHGAFQSVRRAERLMELFQQIQADGGALSPEHAAEIIDAARKSGAGTDGRAAKRGER